LFLANTADAVCRNQVLPISYGLKLPFATSLTAERRSIMTLQKSIRERYQQKIEAYARELAVRRRQDTWLGRLRVITLLPAIGLFYFGLFHAASGGSSLIVAATLVVAFMVVVRVHERALHRATELRQRLQINETQLARLDRRWGLVP